jgi:hypothetical protein
MLDVVASEDLIETTVGRKQRLVSSGHCLTSRLVLQSQGGIDYLCHLVGAEVPEAVSGSTYLVFGEHVKCMTKAAVARQAVKPEQVPKRLIAWPPWLEAEIAGAIPDCIRVVQGHYGPM